MKKNYEKQCTISFMLGLVLWLAGMFWAGVMLFTVWAV